MSRRKPATPVKLGQIAYVTKWILTRGIQEVNVVSIMECYPEVRIQTAEHGSWVLFQDGEDIFSTKKAAKARGLEMIERKRKAIAKQLAKLDKLEKKFQ